MAVTIGEVQVEVREERPNAVPAETPASSSQARVDLVSVLERMRERRERLKAD